MKKDVFYLSNPVYTSLVETKNFFTELDGGENTTKLSCKKYDKAMRDGTTFVCFDMASDIKSKDGLYLSTLKYSGELSFYLDEKQNIVFINSLPKMGEIGCFGQDVANQMVEIVSQYCDTKNTKYVFAPKIKYVVASEKAVNLCNGIEDCKQISFSNAIIDRYKKEEELLRREIIEQKRRADEHDARIEFVLSKKRSFYGMDPNEYKDKKDKFFEEVNEKTYQLYQKRLKNCNHHLEGTKKAILSLIECGDKDIKKEIFNELLDFFNKNKRYLYDRYREYGDECANRKAEFFKELFNEGLIGSRIQYHTKEMFANMERCLSLFMQYFALVDRKSKYKKLLKDKETIFLKAMSLEFVQNNNATNALMFLPGFKMRDIDNKAFIDHDGYRMYDLYMVKPGEINANLKKMQCCTRNVRTCAGESEYFSDRAIFFIPQSLQYKDLKDLLKCVGEHNENCIICEAPDDIGKIEKTLYEMGSDSNVMFFVNNKFYQKWFLEMPYGRELWRKLMLVPHREYSQSVKEFAEWTKTNENKCYAEFLDSVEQNKYIHIYCRGDYKNPGESRLEKWIDYQEFDVSRLKDGVDYRDFAERYSILSYLGIGIEGVGSLLNYEELEEQYKGTNLCRKYQKENQEFVDIYKKIAGIRKMLRAPFVNEKNNDMQK